MAYPLIFQQPARANRMKIKIDMTAIGESRWYEYLVRFAFGGTITVLAGLVAKRYGPGIGGLFLAFPAIFPATATLLDKHERQKKERVGKRGTERGRVVAGVDAMGAALGSIGLIAFALIVWRGLPNSKLGIVLPIATGAWILVSVSLWLLRELRRRTRTGRVPSSNRPLHVSVQREHQSSRRTR
jgi:hypothetical protein